MQNRPILFQRWTNVTWGQLTRLSESLKKITARLGKTQLKRYCCSVVVDIDATITPEIEALDLSQDDILTAMGYVTLSHFGGHLVESMPVREVTISNDLEGYLPDSKRDLIVPDAGIPNEGEPVKLKHSFVLAYADRFHAQGQVNAMERVQGAKALSLMSGDSEFVLQFNNFPDLWTVQGLSVSVKLWIHETESELVDRPTRIVRITDLKDPIPVPYGYKKCAFLALVTESNRLLQMNGALNVFPRLEVDGFNELEQLNVNELEIMRRWIREDGNKLGANGAAAGTLLGRTTLVVLDPFQAQRVTEFNAGHDINLWGQLQATQQGEGYLTMLTRIYEDLPATDYAVQMSRDNIKQADRKALMLGGKPIRDHRFNRGEALGLQAKIKTRAEHRQPEPME
jgi:hypothetical protein